MIKTNCFLSLLLCNVALGANFDEPKGIEVRFSAFAEDELSLRGIGARRQIVVTGKYHDGDERDLTRKVRMEAQPAGIVEISKDGWIKPLADGEATVTIHAAGNLKSSVKVRTSESGKIQRVNFPNEITPLFTKYGCNSGGCHGKSGGQNGFRLSLLGFEPDEDYEYIVKEGRGRRIFPSAPDRSLLLTKATNETPHGGGSKISKGSLDYNLIHSWIAQGMPYGEKDDPVLAEVSVFPAQRVLDMNGEQQLVVTAKYSDGSLRDVTRSSIFEVNDEEVGEVDLNGHVTAFEQPGDLGIMIRFQSKVTVFRAIVPLGAPVDHLPPPANYVDKHIFTKLKAVGMPPSEICSDSTFIRRVSLDITGRLPTVEATKAFLADKDPAKRDKLVDQLLDSSEYAEFFANKWSALLRNKRTKTSYQRGNFAFHGWIQGQLGSKQALRSIRSRSGCSFR